MLSNVKNGHHEDHGYSDDTVFAYKLKSWGPTDPSLKINIWY